ncbi:MAG: DUF4184 family protein [Crocinitomicaceae bacterium]
MPFTFSHPAIILPLSKVHYSKLSLTGLITGSLAPDFEYFILMRMQRTHGHELGSFFWFNLPICIILAIIYHGIVKVPLINSLPHFLYERLVKHKNINWFTYLKRYWHVFIYSSAIGVTSHIIWDSFTHDNGLLGASPGFLHLTVPYFNMKLFAVLQLLSTIIGGLYILLFLSKLPFSAAKKQPVLQKMMFWMNVFLMMSIIFIINPPISLPSFIAITIGSFLYSIIGSAIYYKIYERIYSKRKAQF